jgi:hypothetical protein
VAIIAAVCALAGAAVASGGTTAPKRTVLITFTGKGGGRYLDVTRWLEDSTRECYARQTADETLSVSWTIQWYATIAPNGRITATRPGTRQVQGSVDGNSIRDFCDEPQEGLTEVGADWPGTTVCNGPMAIAARGSVRGLLRKGQAWLHVQGPTYGSPPAACELDVRNDQLAAVVPLSAQGRAQLASAGSVSMAVGSRHPTALMGYIPTRTCSHFPHVYDGIVYLYDCEDTLVWDGTVTLAPVR